MTSQAARPLPRRHDSSLAPHWEGAAESRIVIMRCAACSTHVWPPRYACRACGGLEFEWVTLAGITGTVHSHFTAHRAFHPAFADEVPYIAAIVELEPGVRMAGRLTDFPGPVTIGATVEARFQRFGDVTLVYWAPFTGAG